MPMQEHTCEATTEDGRPCGIRMVSFVEGQGYRCRHHRPDALDPQPSKREKAVKPPVSKLRTFADAEQLASWVAIESAAGRLSEPRARAILLAIKEWRQSMVPPGTKTVARLLFDLTQRADAVLDDPTNADAVAALRAASDAALEHLVPFVPSTSEPPRQKISGRAL